MDVVKSAQHLEDSAEDVRTRDRVLKLLLSHGPQTANELSAALELTSAGIRRHLSVLEEDGLIEQIEADDVDRGRGRPPKYYQLSSAGRASFGQAYDDLAMLALEQLIETSGPGAIRKIAETRFQGVADDYHRRLADDPELTPVAALTAALDASGYFASSIECGDQANVSQHHCPVVRVANKYPQLCQAEASIIAELLGADVERQDTIAQGKHSCVLHVLPGEKTMLPNPTLTAHQGRASRTG